MIEFDKVFDKTKLIDGTIVKFDTLVADKTCEYNLMSYGGLRSCKAGYEAATYQANLIINKLKEELEVLKIKNNAE